MTLSPLDGCARLAGRRGRVLLHSGRDDDGLGRWSFAAAEPRATLIARGRSLVILDAAGRPAKRYTADPFEAAAQFLAEHGCPFQASSGAPPEPRVIGFFGYDLARVVEALPGGPALGQDTPDLWLAAYGAVARWHGDPLRSGGEGPCGDPEIVGDDAAARRTSPRRSRGPPRPRSRRASARSSPTTGRITTSRASGGSRTTSPRVTSIR